MVWRMPVTAKHTYCPRGFLAAYLQWSLASVDLHGWTRHGLYLGQCWLVQDKAMKGTVLMI